MPRLTRYNLLVLAAACLAAAMAGMALDPDPMKTTTIVTLILGLPCLVAGVLDYRCHTPASPPPARQPTSPTMSTKTKKQKGRAHWTGKDTYQWTLPHWRIYPDEYDAAVERMARAMVKRRDPEITPTMTPEMAARMFAETALRAIGIAAPRKERGSR